MKTTVRKTITFAASLVVGSVAAVAIASAAAVSAQAPVLRPAQPPTAVEIVRLEPVVVTVSKSYFDAVRKQGAATELARSTDTRRVTRG